MTRSTEAKTLFVSFSFYYVPYLYGKVKQAKLKTHKTLKKRFVCPTSPTKTMKTTLCNYICIKRYFDQAAQFSAKMGTKISLHLSLLLLLRRLSCATLPIWFKCVSLEPLNCIIMAFTCICVSDGFAHAGKYK